MAFQVFVFGPRSCLSAYTAATCGPDLVVLADGRGGVPVTLVPHPGVVSVLGPEVGLAVVVDLGGEAQQAADGALVGGVGRAGQAVLLVGTLQRVHGPVLQVRGLLHHLGIQNQVWGS